MISRKIAYLGNPEFLLVVACCAWPPSEERNAKIREAAAEGLDWARLLSIARYQRVVGFVRDGLSRAAVEVPPAIDRDLRLGAGEVARQNLFNTAESLRLKQLFAAAAIPLLFIKGVSLAILAYGDRALKSGWDIDVLVAPEDLERAGELLERSGYRCTHPSGPLTPLQMRIFMEIEKESVWVREEGTTVELHWRLTNNSQLIPGMTVHAPSQEAMVAPGETLPTLARDQLFSYLCVHGAMCGWFRLKWLADLAALLASEDEAGVEQLYRASLALGVGRCSSQALLLCRRLFSTRMSDALLAELRKDRINTFLERVALESMAGGGGDSGLEERKGTSRLRLFSTFLLGRGWPYVREVARERWFMFEDWIDHPLPERLQFLYHFIRIPKTLWRAFSK